MSERPSLGSMPPEIFIKVANNADYQSLAVLRRLSTHCRTLINNFKPDIHVLELLLQVSPQLISCELVFEDEHIISLEYHNRENGCMIDYEEKQTFLENMNYFDVFETDSQSIWKYLKSEVETLEVKFSSERGCPVNRRFAELLQRSLQTPLNQRNGKFIKVKKLIIKAMEENLVMGVLPYLDSTSLDGFFIRHPDIRNNLAEVQPIESEDMVITEQWRELKVLNADKFVIWEPIQNVLHFNKLKVTMHSISIADLTELKNAAIHSPTFIYYKIRFEDTGHLKQFWTYYQVTNMAGPMQYLRIFSTILDEDTMVDDDEESIVAQRYNRETDEQEGEFDHFHRHPPNPNEFQRSPGHVWYFRAGRNNHDQLLSLKIHWCKKVVLIDWCPAEELPLNARVN